MKRWMYLPLAVLLLWPAALAAQEEEESYSPTWWAVITENVSPAGVAQYEEVSKELMELITANAPEGMEYYTLSGPEVGYIYAIPMESMGQFMELSQTWEGMVDQIGRDHWMELSHKSDEVVSSRTMRMYIQRDDLSYRPETPRMALDDMPMRHYDWIFPIPGKEMEVADVLREWVDLYKSNNVDSGWTTVQAVFGDDLPCFVILTPAVDMADYLADGDRVDELLGEADDTLMKKTMALLRDFEHNNAWMRPELSLVPEEM